MSDNLETFVLWISSILLIAILIFVVIWALKVRLHGKVSEGQNPIRIIQRTQIDAKHKITALEYEDQKFLLASGPNSMAFLKVDHPGDNAGKPAPENFEQLLHKEIDNQGPQA